MNPYRAKRATHRYRLDQGFSLPWVINKKSPQYQGLKAWYPTLGSENSTRLQELIGRSDGAFGAVGGPAWVPDSKLGWVLGFDDGDDYVDLSSFTSTWSAMLVDITSLHRDCPFYWRLYDHLSLDY